VTYLAMLGRHISILRCVSKILDVTRLWCTRPKMESLDENFASAFACLSDLSLLSIRPMLRATESVDTESPCFIATFRRSAEHDHARHRYFRALLMRWLAHLQPQLPRIGPRSEVSGSDVRVSQRAGNIREVRLFNLQHSRTRTLPPSSKPSVRVRRRCCIDAFLFGLSSVHRGSIQQRGERHFFRAMQALS
jgi:hypothetical protein